MIKQRKAELGISRRGRVQEEVAQNQVCLGQKPGESKRSNEKSGEWSQELQADGQQHRERTGRREEKKKEGSKGKERALERLFLHLIKGCAMVNTSSEAYWDTEGDPDSIAP